MLRQILPPRVQNRGDPDGAAQMAAVAPEGEERVGCRTKEERVDYPRIAVGPCVEVVRQGEDDVEVRNGQAVGLARREPPFLGKGLTLWTVPIATGVIGDARGAAAITRVLKRTSSRNSVRPPGVRWIRPVETLWRRRRGDRKRF